MSSSDASIPLPVAVPRSPSPIRRGAVQPSPGISSARSVRLPSPTALPSVAKQVALGLSPGVVNFHTYCQDLINFQDYPDVSAQDRAVITGFLTGELLKNEKWREKFPSGKFECTLQASNDTQSNEYGCKEKIVFKIDFNRVSCIKSITRRVWSAKTRPSDTGSEEIDSESPTRTPSMRSVHSRKRTPKQRRSSYPRESPSKDTPRRSNSFPADKVSSRRQTPRRNVEEANGAGLIELVSPIKQSRGRPRKSSGVKETPKRARSGSKATPSRKKSSMKKEKKAKVSEEIWKVESIVDHKIEGGKDMFLVKWEGKNPETGKPWDNTWEPKANISKDLIDEFWQTHKGKKAKRSTGKSRK